jgi:hypothetical protein
LKEYLSMNSPPTNSVPSEMLLQLHAQWLNSQVTAHLLHHLQTVKQEALHRAMRLPKLPDNLPMITMLLEKSNQIDTLITLINHGPSKWNLAGHFNDGIRDFSVAGDNR